MRFGLIGLGSIGLVRKAALEKTPGCTLSAVYDRDKARVSGLPADVRVFDSADALCASDQCDALIISSPPDCHAEQAIAAMQGGKHVLVEKPMANTLSACRTMLETARDTRRVLTVGFNQRYFAAIKCLRDAIHSGSIGKLNYVKSFAGHTGLSEFRAPWMYDKDIMGGGTLVDNGIHVLDLTRHLMGEIDSVYGRVGTGIWGLDRSEDNAFVLMQGPNGITGALHSSWSEWKGYHFYIEAYGDRGMAKAYYAPMYAMVISMERPGGTRSVRRHFYPLAIVRERLRGWQSTVIQTFVEELLDFVAKAQGDTQTRNIAEAIDGYRAVEIANAVYSSSKSGEVVHLEKTV